MASLIIVLSFVVFFNENCVLFCRLAQRIVRGDVPEPLLNRKVEFTFCICPQLYLYGKKNCLIGF